MAESQTLCSFIQSSDAFSIEFLPSGDVLNTWPPMLNETEKVAHALTDARGMVTEYENKTNISRCCGERKQYGEKEWKVIMGWRENAYLLGSHRSSL